MRTAKPNIILIVMDTARAQNFSCYGYRRSTTPHIDRIAQEGVLYERAYSTAPWTSPAHASLFTGRYPSNCSFHNGNLFLGGDHPVLAEELSRANYQTIGVSSNVFITDYFGFTRGFQTFYKTWQLLQCSHDVFRLKKQFHTSQGWHKLSGIYKKLKGDLVKNLLNISYKNMFDIQKSSAHVTKRTNKLVTRLLDDADRNKPFFLFINYIEPHLDYRPPLQYKLINNSLLSAFRLNSVPQDCQAFNAGALPLSEEDFLKLRALYDAELTFLDDMIGNLYLTLKLRGLLDNTLIILTSDHGENIGEHNLMDHCFSLHDTLLRVPLIMKFPSGMYSPKRITSLAQTVDILPTIREFAGLGNGQNKQSDGISLLPEGGGVRDFAYAEYTDAAYWLEGITKRFPAFDTSRHRLDLHAVIASDGFKLIRAENGAVELYNVIDDSEERRNLADEKPELSMLLQQNLQTWQESLKADTGTVAVRRDNDEILDRLRSLGYL